MTARIIDGRAIAQEKDVEGFHLYNVGSLVIGETVFPRCTPFGVPCFLEHEGIHVEGQNVVVGGASNIVHFDVEEVQVQRWTRRCVGSRRGGCTSPSPAGRAKRQSRRKSGSSRTLENTRPAGAYPAPLKV